MSPSRLLAVLLLGLWLAAAPPPTHARFLAYGGAVLDGVDGVDGLAFVIQEVVSPDGRHVYAQGGSDDAVAAFERDPLTGALSFIEAEVDGVNGVDGLDFATSLAISPDGANVYVTGSDDDAVAVFARSAASGALTFVEAEFDGVNGVEGLDQARGVTVSPDGRHVYVAGQVDHALAVFERDPILGSLTFVAAYHDGVDGIDGLEGVLYVTVSADGANVYTASYGENAVASFRRDPDSGLLTFLQVLTDGVDGVDGLGSVHSIAVSADGRNAYAASQSDAALAVFARNLSDGSLTWTGIVQNGVDGVLGLNGALWVAIGPDDTRVFVASTFDSAIVVFQRDPLTGALTFLDTKREGVDGYFGLSFARSVAVSPDGSWVYVGGASSNAIAIFRVARCGTPQAACRPPVAPGAAILTLKDGGVDAGDALAWQWRKGSATDRSDFGDPLAVDPYTFCVYDESAATPALLLSATVTPNGGACGPGVGPCWRPTRTGHHYRDATRGRDGISRIDLLAGAAGKAKITVAGQGHALDLPALPLAAPLRVQLQSGTGVCWEARYPATGVRRNDGRRFSARSE